MKTFFSLLLIITFASHFGTNAIFAQKKLKPKRVIILELYFKNLEKPETTWLSLNLNEVRSGAGVGGGGVSHSCGECDKSKLPPNYWFNSFYGSVVRKGKASLFLSLDVNQTCKIRQKFIVANNKITKLKLNCDVNLVAYNGIEGKEAN